MEKKDRISKTEKRRQNKEDRKKDGIKKPEK